MRIFGGQHYTMIAAPVQCDTGMPHRLSVSPEALRATFNSSNGSDVTTIERDRSETRFHDNGAPAWFARIKRM